MRCMACGAEMILMNVDRDDPVTIHGSEHHTLKCSECHDVRWHLIFLRHGRESGNAPMPAHAASPIVPASTGQDAQTGLFKRLVAKLTWRGPHPVCRVVHKE
jgi:hypothetical protein